MQVYIAIKYHADHQNRLAIEQITEALEQNGFATRCVTRDLEKWGQVRLTPAELMRQTFAEIVASDLVVVELTEKGVGLGIEAGYAWANGIPIVTIAQLGADISPTLQGISERVLCYANATELVKFFAQVRELATKSGGQSGTVHSS